MKPIKGYKIQFENYSTLIYRIAPKLSFLQRNQEVTSIKQNFDVFPESWFLFLSNMPVGQVSVVIKGREIFLVPPKAIFLPPYSLIRWKQYPGECKWFAIRGETKLPDQLMVSDPFVFSWDLNLELKSLEQILDVVKKGKDNSENLPAELNKSDIAKIFKKEIDQGFESNIKIRNICKKFHLSLASVSHSFKSCYGVSPKEYQNRLQLNQALRKITFENKNLTEACFESGFEEYSNFYRQLKKWLKTGPSQVLFTKNNELSDSDINLKLT